MPDNCYGKTTEVSELALIRQFIWQKKQMWSRESEGACCVCHFQRRVGQMEAHLGGGKYPCEEHIQHYKLQNNPLELNSS